MLLRLVAFQQFWSRLPRGGIAKYCHYFIVVSDCRLPRSHSAVLASGNQTHYHIHFLDWERLNREKGFGDLRWKLCLPNWSRHWFHRSEKIWNGQSHSILAITVSIFWIPHFASISKQVVVQKLEEIWFLKLYPRLTFVQKLIKQRLWISDVQLNCFLKYLEGDLNLEYMMNDLQDDYLDLRWRQQEQV